MVRHCEEDGLPAVPGTCARGRCTHRQVPDDACTCTALGAVQVSNLTRGGCFGLCPRIDASLPDVDRVAENPAAPASQIISIGLNSIDARLGRDEG